MMAEAFRDIALSFAGTSEQPHFERTAFKVRRIYATLSPDGKTANLKLTPDEQEFKCMLAPEVFAPVPNAWGKQGWTTLTLANATAADLKAALEMAWTHAVPAKPARGKRA